MLLNSRRPNRSKFPLRTTLPHNVVSTSFTHIRARSILSVASSSQLPHTPVAGALLLLDYSFDFSHFLQNRCFLFF